MAHDLSRRVAIITGASSGIGAAVARVLCAAGCRCVINARRADRLESIAGELNGARPGTAATVVGDASEARTIDAMFEKARASAGAGGLGAPADLVVVNAGRGLSGSILTSDTAQWEDMVRTNLIGAARLMRKAAEELTRLVEAPEGEAGVNGAWLNRPRDIVVIGSSVGRNISPFSSMYGSTKFGLHSLAEAMRREIGPKGVRVTLVEPAIVESEFQSVAGYDPTTFGAFMRRIGPVLTPRDVAEQIEFVVSRPAHVHACDVMIRPTRQDYP